MKEIQIGNNEDGKRLSKLLRTVLNEAGDGFIFKMLRKKNITLNGNKATGKEIVRTGDTVQIFLSDETYDRFHKEDSHIAESRNTKTKGSAGRRRRCAEEESRRHELSENQVLYRDANILILHKPATVLSQKSGAEDDSMNDRMLRYVIREGIIPPEQLDSFKPSICNRLDRNTSGILLAGISLPGSRFLSEMLHDRTLAKYYVAVVAGEVKESASYSAYLSKNTSTNQVSVSAYPLDSSWEPIETAYRPIQVAEYKGNCYTLLEVQLITGKSHQIRAHLSYLRHPILGDMKYGHPMINTYCKREFGVQHQCLHAYRVVFPEISDAKFQMLSGREIKDPMPDSWKRMMKTLFGGIDGNLEQ